jgi:cell division septation protein DedD
MASGGRRSAGDRVLEGKHVIGLFLLMLLFSGVFFSLGYVMGRNQYNAQVRAETTNSRTTEPAYVPKNDPSAKKRSVTPDGDLGTDPSSSDKIWNYAHTSSPSKNEPRLDAAPKPTTVAAPAIIVNPQASVPPPPATVKTNKNSVGAPLIPRNALILQVAALTKQDDALDIASSLQKRHFAAYVSPPQKDKFYRVQVGPFKDQKSADAAKKGLENAGFRAFVVKH